MADYNSRFSGASQTHLCLAMRFHQINQFHEDPRIIAWWQAGLGALTWLTPTVRRRTLWQQALWVASARPGDAGRANSGAPGPGGPHPGSGGFPRVFPGWSSSGHRYASLPPGSILNRPLHGVYWGPARRSLEHRAEAGVWRQVFVAVGLMFPFMLWRFGYVLMAWTVRAPGGTRFTDHFLVLWPYYGGTNTPYGNVALATFPAARLGQRALARSQLAGDQVLLSREC